MRTRAPPLALRSRSRAEKLPLPSVDGVDGAGAGVFDGFLSSETTHKLRYGSHLTARGAEQHR